MSARLNSGFLLGMSLLLVVAALGGCVSTAELVRRGELRRAVNRTDLNVEAFTEALLETTEPYWTATELPLPRPLEARDAGVILVSGAVTFRGPLNNFSGRAPTPDPRDLLVVDAGFVQNNGDFELRDGGSARVQLDFEQRPPSYPAATSTGACALCVFGDALAMGALVTANVVDRATLGLFSMLLDPVGAAAQEALSRSSQRNTNLKTPTEAEISAWQEKMRAWLAKPEVREALAVQALIQDEGARLVHSDAAAFVSRLRWHADTPRGVREFVVALRVPLVVGAASSDGKPLRFRCETRATFASAINEKATHTQYSMRCEAQAQALRR